MKKTKLLALFLALCLLVSGCSFEKKGPEKDDNIIEREDNLSANIEIKPEIPESSESSSSEPEPESEPAVENEIGSLEELSPYFQEFADLGSEQIPWGPGTNFDETGKPIACIGLQAEYGKWDTDFYRDGEEHKGKVYLTFDEGYENGYTPKILDVLKEKGVSAVFFVTLSYAKAEPELIQRMIDEGHVVGNHSSRHPNMTKITMEEMYAEVADLHNYISENFGYDMYLFRPPEGAFSERSLALLQKMGYRTVCWSFAYADWDPANQPEKQAAFERVTRSVHDGEVFLLHAVSETNTAILGDVIDHVRNEGFTFEKYLP
ncbi:MAG: polysaccharide deacetylase [Ruminococcaceae bacterium]|nr:polysaccharide deacetylase [Oscillospiraceae bacterium]